MFDKKYLDSVLHACEKYLDSVYMLVRSTSLVFYNLVRGYLFTHSNISIKLPGIFLNTRGIGLLVNKICTC